jgi:hypothetical protein
MRPVQLSTETFAAIWADRQPGEESEDAIIARRFGVKRTPPKAKRDLTATIGFHDPRFGFRVDNGFTIERVFKGKKHVAQAIQGFWVSSHDGRGYPSLNELSKAIGAGTENAWKAWFYQDGKSRRPVADLRDTNTIAKRKTDSVSLSDLGL